MNKPLMFKSPSGEEVYLALMSGHTGLVTGEWGELHPMFHRMAMTKGCIRSDMSEEAIKTMTGAVIDPGKNESHDEIILSALQAMVADDDDEDFTTSGFPDLRRLRARTGFGVDRDDMLRIWNQMKEEATEGDVEHGDAV